MTGQARFVCARGVPYTHAMNTKQIMRKAQRALSIRVVFPRTMRPRSGTCVACQSVKCCSGMHVHDVTHWDVLLIVRQVSGQDHVDWRTVPANTYKPSASFLQRNKEPPQPQATTHNSGTMFIRGAAGSRIGVLQRRTRVTWPLGEPQSILEIANLKCCLE